MNNETFSPNQRETLPKRLAKGIPAAIGGIVLTAALSTGAWRSAIGWSPTSTARRCFYFPEYSDLISSLPDRDEIKQFLLMKSFFGSDSLYFDLGDENTGETHLTPAESSNKTPPQSSIEALTAFRRMRTSIRMITRKDAPASLLSCPTTSRENSPASFF